MKKLTAIFFLFIFFFNAGGYRLWIYYAQQQSDIKLVQALDKNDYKDADLISIKVPLYLPYQNDWKEYERTDGEITVEGKMYKYVKRIVQNGEMILLCIPDKTKMHLENIQSDFFKYSNDLVQHNSSKKSDAPKASSYKNLLSEFCQHSVGSYKNQITFNSPGFSLLFQPGALTSSPHISPEQPPDIIPV